MKQILQNLKTGQTRLTEVPVPGKKSGNELIQTQASLISAGTERMLIEFGKAGWIDKARQQPEKVRQVLDKIRTDGLLPTVDAVRNKLDQPLPLGYCNVGTITEGPQKGKRVASNGLHAEYVSVPKNLCALIPDAVSDEEAAFTVVGAIGLQGIRLAQPTIGEWIVVTGLGLIGLLTVRILMASGCRVLGLDFDPAKCDIARKSGANVIDLSKNDRPIEAVLNLTNGVGVDGVLITAATKSSEPVHQAAQMCRKRGRIVLVGVTGLELNRSDFYEKELSFQVSCSYGPGRYDPEYEQNGHDYPIGYVRWTEQRNFEAVLNLMAAGALNVKPLISHRFDFDNAEAAYDLIATNKEPYLGILLNYNTAAADTPETAIRLKDAAPAQTPVAQPPVVGVIGAGNFTGGVILPALQKTGARLKSIASGSGITGTHLAHKFGFEKSTTDVGMIFDDPDVNVVIITTPHASHAMFVLRALKSGKNVFVEKPLCMNFKELKEISQKIETDLNNGNPLSLMVGFNRRFAPHIIQMKTLLDTVQTPKSFIMTVNAGHIPADHWTQDPKIGGGRIIGEACHFIDLLRFLADASICEHSISTMNAGVGDTVSIQLGFADGSIGTIHYFANGNKAFPKERLEIFCGQRILQLDNFRVLQGYGWNNFKKMWLWRQDKGHNTEIDRFIKAIRDGEPSPIDYSEIEAVMATTLTLARSAHAA